MKGLKEDEQFERGERQHVSTMAAHGHTPPSLDGRLGIGRAGYPKPQERETGVGARTAPAGHTQTA